MQYFKCSFSLNLLKDEVESEGRSGQKYLNV